MSPRLRALGVSTLLAVALTGCVYDHGHHDDCMGPGCGPYGPGPADVVEATIDTGATLSDIDPGQGAGAFVEYQSGGHWRVFTACDSEVTKLACHWDIIVSVEPGADLVDFAGEELESADQLFRDDARTVHLIASNTTDLDGFVFEATPGATARVDVFLDGGPAPAFVFWVGNGGLHQGAPTNPIDLTPSSD